MLLWLIGCGTSGGRIESSPRDRVDAGPVALHVEHGSRVRVQGSTLAVDAPDGRRWFDLTWTAGDPSILADAWAAGACEPIVWDEPVVGPPGTWWARGGMCTVADRRHWALVMTRPTTDGGLVRTTYLADHAFVPYEDAWVDFVGTALSAHPGGPVEVASPAEVRSAVRTGTAKGAGHLPIPGGGLISTQVNGELVGRWSALAPLPPGPPRL